MMNACGTRLYDASWQNGGQANLRGNPRLCTTYNNGCGKASPIDFHEADNGRDSGGGCTVGRGNQPSEEHPDVTAGYGHGSVNMQDRWCEYLEYLAYSRR